VVNLAFKDFGGADPGDRWPKEPSVAAKDQWNDY
jgi:hypothetical protein